MDHHPHPLEPDEVHVWSFALVQSPAEKAHRESLLSAEERARANAFHFPSDREGYVIAHGMLRTLLGKYLQRAPAELKFVTGSHGKPRFAGGPEGEVRFNLSHSHGRALVALARGCEVGVDLEQIRPEVECAEIVTSQFSPGERAAWLALPEPVRRAAFFHGWARKEAYVKARGDGLSHPPDAYTVDLDPAGDGRLIADATMPEAATQWTVRTIPAPAGFAAAVAWSGGVRSIRFFEL